MCCVNTTATTSIPEKGRKLLISPLPFHHLTQNFERSGEVREEMLPQFHFNLPRLFLWCIAPSSFCTTSPLRRFDKWNGTHLFMAHWFLHLYIPNTSVSTLDAVTLSVKQKKKFTQAIILNWNHIRKVNRKYYLFQILLAHVFL